MIFFYLGTIYNVTATAPVATVFENSAFPSLVTAVFGYVYDNTTRMPIENATVDIYINGAHSNTTFTTRTGYYKVNVTAGNLHVFVYAVAHAPSEKHTTITAGEQLQIDFYLDSDTTPPLILDVKINTFENISFYNPFQISGTVVEKNSKSRTVWFGKYLNSTPDGKNYVIRKGFSNRGYPFLPTETLDEVQPQPGMYNFTVEWRANINSALLNDSIYEEQVIYIVVHGYPVVTGIYYNSTAAQSLASAVFDFKGNLIGIYSLAIDNFVNNADATGRFAALSWVVTTDKSGEIIATDFIRSQWLNATKLRITDFYAIASTGEYIVWLKTDDWGNNSANKTYFIKVDTEPPIANAGPDIVVNQHETVILNASLSEDNVCITNYSWEFIYENKSAALYGMVAKFVFDIAGIYEITLNVTDAAGNFATDILKVIVMDTTPPVAVAGSDVTIKQHETLVFNASLSTDNVGISTYVWVFAYEGLTVSLTGAVVNFTFHAAGFYVVTLQVTDTTGNMGTDCLNVTVLDITPPVANAGSDIFINLHEAAIFDASLSTDNVGIVNHTWSFTYKGDKKILYGAVTRFVFDLAGTFMVTLKVVDAAGNFGIDFLNVTVKDTEPPVITHEPIKEWFEGKEIKVIAAVTDNVAVAEVILYYRPKGALEYNSIPMLEESGVWTATIPASAVKGEAIEYFIIARDTTGNIAEYPSDGRNYPVPIVLRKELILPVEIVIALILSAVVAATFFAMAVLRKRKYGLPKLKKRKS